MGPSEARLEANALLLAVGNKDEALVREMLDRGVHPDAVEDEKHPSGLRAVVHGDSALWVALSRENVSSVAYLAIARILVEHGADVDMAMGHDNRSMIRIAATNNLLNVAWLLIKAGADLSVPTAHQDQTPLHLAALHGNWTMTHLLIDHGAKLDLQNWQGETPLHIASARGYVEIVSALIAAGAMVDLYARSAGGRRR
tara:strand:+ start:197 stop:793 length:597 start_codon:yes stop_codon:yes gene_type:complete